MSSWKDDKDLGPWDFTEQPDKWGYLNNPRWSNHPKGADDSMSAADFCANVIGLPIGPDETHLPCGHWHKNRQGQGGESIPSGKWVACLNQPNQPYLYLYDITYYSIIKVDTSQSPPTVVDRLVVNDSDFNLDYDMGYGMPGTQRGGYCMNKDGTRVWYLFRGTGDYADDCRLVEVDVSTTPMTLINSTVIDGLLPTYSITDGCADNNYTYWSTSLNTGEIIKLSNSTHTLVEDKLFNFPLPDEPIASIDVDVNNDILYWIYCGACEYGQDFCNAIGHYMRSDTDFNNIVDVEYVGMGGGTHSWQNFVRVYGNYLLQHRAYHPISGPLSRWNLDFSSPVGYGLQYMQNLLGVIDGVIYILQHDNTIADDAHLATLSLSTMTGIDSVTVNYYVGHGYLQDYDWEPTSVSGVGDSTGVSMIFRWNHVEGANYGASFDTSMNLLFDERMDYMLTSSEPDYLQSNEPQIWTMDF